MDYFRKTKDRLMESVGFGHKIPDDPELLQAQQRIKLLYTTVQSMNRSMHQYAESMCMVGEAARTLSDDISKFYSKSPPHQKTVGVFIDASLDQESNALLLFKEQFSDDIDHHFELWLHEIRQQSDRLRALLDLHHRIHQLKHKIEDGQKNPSTYQSEAGQSGTEGVRADMQSCLASEKSFGLDKTTLITTINDLLTSRYQRFDVVFMRLMEFQKEFFADGLDVTEKFAPIVETYRQNNKITGSSTSTATPAASRSSGSTSQQSHVQQTAAAAAAPTPTASKPLQPSIPEHSKPTPQQQQPTPPQQQQQQQHQQPPPSPKERNLFDLDFGSSTTPSQSQSKPQPQSQSQQQQQQHTPQVFDLFGGSVDSTTTTTTTSPPASKQPAARATSTGTGSQQQDLFGDIFSTPAQSGTKPQHTSNHDSLEDFFSGTGSTSTPKPSTPASPNLGGFDSFLSSSTSSRSGNNGGIDDIDDDASSKPKPSASSTSSSSSIFTSSFSSAKPNSFDSFDPLGPASTPASTPKVSQPPQPEQPQGPQLTQNEEKEQIQNYKQGLENRIEQWRYRHGQERDIQALLSSLHTILWTGHTWKKVDTTSLLDHPSIKKSFRRALLTVHPDKVSTGTPEMKATADLVFEILNNAFKRYEVQQGLRSA